ncbi:styrene monooxygenase subunit StyA [Donghicola tyrosinivorans]|uniref:Styrene monooxygenase n=1 Tax=Donghicola tyrosinivorans TaxID=1652492 RepID=A0A2T0WH76_9RHOB|nr:styrene monooxygenase/indole monooxygenase family protein [Donghicola tyrosinivorans]PRY86053.1 styrene monooxygenase [Donghicola tyrosinivorans]
MSKTIAIIGAGTAGLQLGLHLLQNGITPKLYTDRTPEEYAGARLMNTVAHHHVTTAREDALGCNHWPSDEYGYFGHYYYIGTPDPIHIYGDLARPSRAVDYRIYQPKLLQDYIDRGGEVVYGAVEREMIEGIADEHDLTVVCTGKGPIGQMFGRDDRFSPFERPQRMLCVGLFKGIQETETRAVTMYFSPGAGELIEIPTWSFNGWCQALVFENHIGGDLEVLAKTKYDDDPRAFLDLLLEKIEKHYPTLYARIDREAFDLANSNLDLLQGGVTPTVRKTYTTLENGKLAVALGDVHAVVDPVLGQGANMASYAAVILGEEIVANDVFDQRFIEKFDARRHDRVMSGTRWTNYMLENLAKLDPTLLQYIGGMAQSRDLTDQFTEDFNHPEKQWDVFSSPERVRAAVARSQVPMAAE